MNVNLTRYRNITYVFDGCCPAARKTYLMHLMNDSFADNQPPASTKICPGGYLWNNPENASNHNLSFEAVRDREYLIPQYTFDCSGCIENVSVLVNTTEVSTAQDASVTIYLWSVVWGNSLNTTHNVIYKRNGSISLIASHVMQRPNTTNMWLVTFSIPRNDTLCFSEGQVLGIRDTSNAMLVTVQDLSSKTQIVNTRDDDVRGIPCELNEIFEADATEGHTYRPWVAVETGIYLYFPHKYISTINIIMKAVHVLLSHSMRLHTCFLQNLLLCPLLLSHHHNLPLPLS